MKKFSILNYQLSIDAGGFTLIELLIVIAISMVISVVALASFSSYNTSQKLTTATLGVKNLMQYAKSQALSQVTTCSSGQILQGYKFLACCQGSGCPTCLSSNNYEVDEVCSGGSTFVSGGNFPSGVSVDTTNSTSFSYTFTSLSNTVTGAGTLILKQDTATKSLTISATGIIQ